MRKDFSLTLCVSTAIMPPQAVMWQDRLTPQGATASQWLTLHSL